MGYGKRRRLLLVINEIFKVKFSANQLCLNGCSKPLTFNCLPHVILKFLEICTPYVDARVNTFFISFNITRYNPLCIQFVKDQIAFSMSSLFPSLTATQIWKILDKQRIHPCFCIRIRRGSLGISIVKIF